MKNIPSKWEKGASKFIDFKLMWDSLTYREDLLHNENIILFKDEVKLVYANGGAAIHCFEMPQNDLFDYILSTPAYKEQLSLTILLASKPFRENAKEFDIKNDVKIFNNFINEPVFKWMSSFVLDGFLTELLVIGGAYKRFDRKASEAKNICINFCNSLFEDRYSDVQVYYSDDYWSKWFNGVAWDSTFVIFDSKLKRVWILALTDTD